MKGLCKIIGIPCILLLLGCQSKEVIHGLSAYEALDSLTVFAPELALMGNTYKGSFSDDYTSFYYFKKRDSVTEKYIPYEAQFMEGRWTTGSILPYYDKTQSYTYQLNVPGSDRHIFIADLRMAQDTSAHPNYTFWSVAKAKGQWGIPEALGPTDLVLNYNSQPCITTDGSIFFTSNTPDWATTLSYKMDVVDGEYQEPNLFAPVNQWRKNKKWKVYEYAMAPDKSYLIACIQEQNERQQLNTDLYISYPKKGSWTQPKRLGGGINTLETENFPYITPKGDFLLFTRAFSQFYIVPVKQLMAETKIL